MNEGRGGQVPDDSALTLTRFEQAGELQYADGVPYGGAADLKTIGQFTFRGQLVTGPQAPFGDEPANPFGDFLVDLSPPNRCEFADDRRRLG